MSKAKLEYIWLDGYKPTQSLRSKTKIVKNFSGKLEDVEVWCFDGSSTQQVIDYVLDSSRRLPNDKKTSPDY